MVDTKLYKVYPLTNALELRVDFTRAPLLCSLHTGAAIALKDASEVIALSDALEALTEDWRLTGGRPDWSANA